MYYLETFQKRFVLAPIDMAANNVALIYKWYCVEVLSK